MAIPLVYYILHRANIRAGGVLEYPGHTGIVCYRTKWENGLENSNDE